MKLSTKPFCIGLPGAMVIVHDIYFYWLHRAMHHTPGWSACFHLHHHKSRTTTHHDLHHSEGPYNYGFYFTFWDRWMGTEHPQYKERFREAAKPLVISRRFAERVSVLVMAVFTASFALQSAGFTLA